ncbi:uncharacterized protein TNIN_222401 [Trichonephila inaurata madagascariensis]|uniref:Uncharacterized protein n=1 Tax=Trichonephila inaurata madagascariensis TaxID=2747483 RepID=A0A8X6XJ28_9ARAC|nr:uncharacterized protein TNIN_222401 [Trichonephila inaurata madagascariensis]
MYNDIFQNLAAYHPKASIVYVYGAQQKALFKDFCYLPVVDVLESPCFKNIPEPKNSKRSILNGHHPMSTIKNYPSLCSFNKSLRMHELYKLEIDHYSFNNSCRNDSHLQELNDPFYFIWSIPKLLLIFFFETVRLLNCPVDTRIEMQVCTEDYSVIKVEFSIRTEEGWYNKEFKQENAERVHDMMSNHVSWTVTPEAWLDIVIQASAIVFPMLKMRTPQRKIIHIWTTRAFYDRLWFSECFSTVAYLEWKQTRDPRMQGKKIFKSLMDLPPLDIVIGGSTELWKTQERRSVYKSVNAGVVTDCKRNSCMCQ